MNVRPHPHSHHADANPWDVALWDAKGWAAAFGLLGLVAGAFGWGWKKIIRPIIHHFLNVFRMPARIEMIVEKQQAIHERLLRSEGRSRQVFDTLKHPIWESDAEGRTIFANRFMLELLGVQFADLSGDGWRVIVHHDDRENVFDEWDSAIARKHDFILDYRWLDSHQRAIPISVVCRRITDGDNTIGYIGHVTLLFGAAAGVTQSCAPLSLLTAKKTDRPLYE